MTRRSWGPMLEEAAGYVHARDSEISLRQVHYLLVANPDNGYRNTKPDYTQLSSRTAAARRDGAFPAMIDQTRSIECLDDFGTPGEAIRWLAQNYTVDRTAGQQYAVYIVVEKATMVPLLSHWYLDLGVPIVALRGYSSQTYTDEVVRHVRADGRPAVMLYGGDFDPSGEDIERDFTERTGIWSHVHRVALTSQTVEEYRLPPAPGKATDSRAAGFAERHGELIQVELEALPPETLKALYDEKLARYWDDDAYQRALEVERDSRSVLGQAHIPGQTGQ